MLTALIFTLISAQEPTITFTHRCARAEVVVQALGEELGRTMKVSGSVKDDYFLVRFDNTPVEEALKRIAKTLNATWSKSGDVTYLTRTAGQERQEEKEEQDKIDAAISEYMNAPIPAFPSQTELIEAIQNAADADKNKNYSSPAIMALYKVSPDAIAMNLIGKTLDPRKFRELELYDSYFVSLKPHPLLDPIPPAAVAHMKTVAEYATRYSTAVEASGTANDGYRQSFRSSIASPDIEELIFGISRQRSSLAIRTITKTQMSAGSSFHALWIQRDQPAPDISIGSGLFTPPEETPIAMGFAHPANVSDVAVRETINQRLLNCTESDPLDWLGSEPILQAAEREGWDVVALLPDNVGWYPYWLSHGERAELSQVLKSYFSSWAVVDLDSDAGFLSVRPRHPVEVRASRIDRETVKRLVSALNAKRGYIEEVGAIYESERDRGERFALMRLIASAFDGYSERDLNYIGTDIAPVFLGGLSDQEKRAAKREGGMTLPLSRVSPGVVRAIKRMLAMGYSGMDLKVPEGDRRMPGPIELLILTADPQQTLFTAKVRQTDKYETIYVRLDFAGGVYGEASALVNAPK